MWAPLRPNMNFAQKIQDEKNQRNSDISPLLFVQTEGTATHANYWGSVLTPEDEQWIREHPYIVDLPGLSSALFAFSWNDTIKQIFTEICTNKKQVQFKDSLYTHDQPLFNDIVLKYIYNMKPTGTSSKAPPDIYPIKKSLTRYNISTPHSEFSKDTTVLNFCGEPGDASVHFEKLFTQLILSFVGMGYAHLYSFI
jgi:hypothetical protein